MKKPSVCLLVFASMIFLHCSSMTIKSDFDPQADFAQYKTYAWMPRVKPGPVSLNEKRIAAAVEQKLAAKGMQSASGAPDFLVVVHTNVKGKIDVDTYGYRYGRYGRRFGTYTTVREYQQGTMVIDFIDAKTRELFWRGWAKGEVNDAESATKKIDGTVAKILAQYPPK